MDLVMLWIGWLLVWSFGAAALIALASPSRLRRDGEMPFLVGAGFLAGQFLLTVWMRLLALVGLHFGLGTIGLPLLAAAAIALTIAWRRHRASMLPDVPGGLAALTGRALPARLRFVAAALLAWLALRAALLLIEVLRRPLFPWDAWTQWATKARVWFAEGTLVPFVSSSQWLSLPNASVWFDAAPHYPATVPLTQVWSAILLGRFDDALVNLPWWLTAVAFGLAIYGFLRGVGLAALIALVGTWLVVSLPILDTHVALAGYADLAMSAYFTLSGLALLRFLHSRSRFDLAVLLVMALACVTIKNPGKLWLAMLVPALVAGLVPKYGLRIAGAMFALAALVALVLTRVGITFLGYRLQLEFDMPWSGLTEAYFTFANWHLLFYGVVAVVLLAGRRAFAPPLVALTLIVAAGFAFLMFGFAFTNARQWVEDQSTVNRATLHLAPLIVVWMILAFRAWADERAKATVARPADPQPPREAATSAPAASR
jgi:hypothetical protein